MEIQKLLGTHTCTCGRTHSCKMRAVHTGPGAIKKLREETKEYHKILVVADQNTYRVCGEHVKALLGDSLEDLLIYTGEGYLVPDEAAISAMEQKLTGETDLLVGIGSGVIQDLCKYVSFQAGLPYQIVATAPSMDGYASSGAALILGSRKVTKPAHVPEVVIGDTDLLKEAPLEMLQAGYGDILGKYSCLNDWKLGQVVNGEYFCLEVYRLTYEMLHEVRILGPKLLERDPLAVQTLMEALVGVGIAMSYVGNSRPASGSEHHLAHFFEVVGLLRQESYFAHGIDVAYGAYVTCQMREELCALDTWPGQQKEHQFSWEAWEQEIREIYQEAAEGVIALQRQLGWHEKDFGQIYQEKWKEIRSVLSEGPSSRELLEDLSSVGLTLSAFEKMYGAEKIGDAIRYARELKDRYTVLWLYNAYLE